MQPNQQRLYDLSRGPMDSMTTLRPLDVVIFKGSESLGEFTVDRIGTNEAGSTTLYCTGHDGQPMTMLEENAMLMRRAQFSPHQQRVVEEREELQGRIDRLFAFTGTDTFRLIDIYEQMRLVRQLNLMRQLRDVLDERIAAFKPA